MIDSKEQQELDRLIERGKKIQYEIHRLITELGLLRREQQRNDKRFLELMELLRWEQQVRKVDE